MKITIGSKKTKFLSDKMFGLFFEDINYGADGGLYAEMIENRQFNFRRGYIGKLPKSFEWEYACGYGWQKFTEAESCQMSFIEGNALCEKNPHYMNFTVLAEEGAFTNKAYDGVCMKAGENYKLLLWIRNPSYKGKLSGVTCDCDDVYFDHKKGYIELPNEKDLYIRVVNTAKNNSEELLKIYDIITNSFLKFCDLFDKRAQKELGLEILYAILLNKLIHLYFW